MECHKLGPKAYRVTKKFELVTITSPLFDMDFLKVDYTVAGLGVTGMELRRVGADMDMNKIETWVDPALPSQGWTDTCGEPAGTIRVIFKPENIQPFTMTAQALVIHEGVHASLRRRKIASSGHLEEAAGYLAQALFFELNGELILETWKSEHEWEMNLDHIDDPIQADFEGEDLCRRREVGREVRSQFGARRRPYRGRHCGAARGHRQGSGIRAAAEEACFTETQAAPGDASGADPGATREAPRTMGSLTLFSCHPGG